MTTIRPLTGISDDDIFSAWSDAFEGYARTWTKAELANDLERRGYVPHLSFGAFEDGRLVSFTLNGIGMHKGLKTAYDTGTGTVKDHRGKGYSTKIFDASLPLLRQEGIAQYLLEVLQQNGPAIAIYKKAGFLSSRELGYCIQNMSGLKPKSKEVSADIQIREIDLQAPAMADMWDVMPSWQNSFDAIYRRQQDFKILGAFHGHHLIGYGIIAPHSGDIPQLAITKAYRRQGIGSGILKALLAHNKSDVVKIINIDSACKPIITFLDANGIPQTGKQYEMIRTL